MKNRMRLGLAGVLAICLTGLGSAEVIRAQGFGTTAPPGIEKGYGSKSAPIHMEVFSDFQCPACRGLYEMTLRQVIANYVATGKVYLIHRDMPLPNHPYARTAARYANAAAKIGKMESVISALYANQDRWSANGNVEAAVASVLTPAELRQVRELVRAQEIERAIDADVALARQRQVRSTPTIFITHRGRTTPLPPGGVSYQLLKQYFDYLLQQ
ncbi:MAG: DsbA family protein [Firmicutes bacterium]|nr:DsbA family protein [Bacillota bacterium]